MRLHGRTRTGWGAQSRRATSHHPASSEVKRMIADEGSARDDSSEVFVGVRDKV